MRERMLLVLHCSVRVALLVGALICAPSCGSSQSTNCFNGVEAALHQAVGPLYGLNRLQNTEQYSLNGHEIWTCSVLFAPSDRDGGIVEGQGVPYRNVSYCTLPYDHDTYDAHGAVIAYCGPTAPPGAGNGGTYEMASDPKIGELSAAWTDSLSGKADEGKIWNTSFVLNGTVVVVSIYGGHGYANTPPDSAIPAPAEADLKQTEDLARALFEHFQTSHSSPPSSTR